jgi:hypothetical protein
MAPKYSVAAMPKWTPSPLMPQERFREHAPHAKAGPANPFGSTGPARYTCCPTAPQRQPATWRCYALTSSSLSVAAIAWSTATATSSISTSVFSLLKESSISTSLLNESSTSTSLLKESSTSTELSVL